ncbi:PLAC8-domain-containing protein [Hymenopellis radicata]|nr:PLAC8-domain-containing protein [Hymenopellis radicata]
MDKGPYNQQPTATQPMTVGMGGNRNAKNKPMKQDGRAWSFGLCSCSGACGTCKTRCTALWCPCVVYGRNKQRLEHLNRAGYPDPEHGGCVNDDCLVHGLLTFCVGFGWILQIPLRGNIRTRYNIAGGACGDCCTTFCCSPCELTQGSQEIQLEEQSFVAHPQP